MKLFDLAVKSVWLIIGLVLLVWLGFARGPQEWTQWQRARERARAQRSAPVRPAPEPAIIVGEPAAADRAAGLERQGIRFPRVLDPCRVDGVRIDHQQAPRPDDWLLIAVTLETYMQPRVNAPPPPRTIEAAALDSGYRWSAGVGFAGYRRIPLQAVNIVFYRRDGTDAHLMLDSQAWVEAVYLPYDAAGYRREERYYVELATADTNGDGRVGRGDDVTLWSISPSGRDLSLIWLPPGDVIARGEREPLSGDLFFTHRQDTDGSGTIDEHDQPMLMRVALGDTVARTVVPAAMIEVIRGIVFGREDSLPGD